MRNTDRVSAFPAGINAAASFDRALMRARGAAMGAEFRAKGVHVQLGPMMCVFPVLGTRVDGCRNLGRVAQGGRNWEGSGPDPYRASRRGSGRG